MPDPRVGIVGLGRIGHSFGVSMDGDPLAHSEAFAAAGAALAWGVDPRDEARACFAGRFPAARTFSTLGEVAAAEPTEIVVVSSPTPDHGPDVVAALQLRPRVVVCEKPLAGDLSAARSVVEACRARGALLVVNYTRRFAPLLDLLRREQRGGVLDAATGAVFRYTGGLQHNGTHWIDLARAIFGDVTDARGLPAATDAGDPPQSVQISHASGARVLLAAVEGVAYSLGEGELWGPHGAARFTAGGARVQVSRVIDSTTWKGYRTLAEPELLASDALRGAMLELARHACELARGDGTPRCTGEDGIAALEAVRWVRASWRESLRS
jgi:predicted dehydrogenase